MYNGNRRNPPPQHNNADVEAIDRLNEAIASTAALTSASRASFNAPPFVNERSTA